MSFIRRFGGLVALLAAVVSAPAASGIVAPEDTPVLAFPPVDPPALLARDAALEAGGAPGPLRFAEPVEMLATPQTDGAWTSEPDGARTWRLVVEVPGATDLNFGFRRFDVPEGALLTIAAGEGREIAGPYGSGDAASGQLWTSILPGSRAVLTLTLPAGAREPGLELSQIGAGYRDVLRIIERPVPMSGSCNVDVACPAADGWRSETRSVVRYSIGGSGLCTATLVMDVPRDFRPFMLSANHCGVDAANAPSIVAYWRYEATSCNGPRDGATNAVTQNGATFRAALRAPDFALFEMTAPPPADANAYWSGWDRSDVAPPASVAIHHPNGDEKAISFDNDPPTKGDSCIGTGGVNTHWYVGRYELGTTEPGSSGCALWDATTHRVVGTLSGGNASCTNLDYDCYGRFGIHWDSGTSPAQRLRDWLDPAGTGALTVDGGRPGAAGIELQAVTTGDACALGHGDLNGVVEPGETITLDPVLHALGNSFTAVSATLTGAPAGVSLVDANATWPDLADGASAGSDPPHLTLTVGTNVPCDATLAMTLRVTAAEGGPFDLPVSLRVGEADPRPATLPVAVPDLATAQSDMFVQADVVVTGLSVRVRMTHSYVGDLRLQLLSPQGTRVTILDRPGHPAVNGGCRDDDMNVTFSDAGAVDLETWCAGTAPWYDGVALSAVPLASFAGERTAGTWSLIAADMGAGDIGTIDDWELITTPSIGGRCEACSDCPGQVIATATPDVLRVVKGAGGSVVLTFPGATSPCASGVQVRMSPTARPSSGMGSFPADPPFADVTAQDLEPGAAFRHVPPNGLACYLVVEDLAAAPGPSGSYGF